jgi:acyl-CoA thioesterase FadM
VLLLFRFLLVMLRGCLRRRISVLDESVVRFTVLPHDCDLNFHLNSGRYLSFMDVARGDLIGRLRLLRPLIKRGWRPVMGGCVIRFRRSVLPFQRFSVRSRVLGWDEKWFYVEHIVEQDGKFCAAGHVRTLIRSRSANIPPAEVWALIGADKTPSPELPPFVANWRELEDAR